jgi:hypothetical protein
MSDIELPQFDISHSVKSGYTCPKMRLIVAEEGADLKQRWRIVMCSTHTTMEELLEVMRTKAGFPSPDTHFRRLVQQNHGRDLTIYQIQAGSKCATDVSMELDFYISSHPAEICMPGLLSYLPHIHVDLVLATSAAMRRTPIQNHSVYETIVPDACYPPPPIRQAVIIVDQAGVILNSVTCCGETFFPYALLPNEGGLELRAQYRFEYYVGDLKESEDILAARIKHNDEWMQVSKLVRELTTALQNSKAASEQLSDILINGAKDDALCDMSELAAMMIEQRRIHRELNVQTAKMPALQRQVVPKHQPNSGVRRSSWSSITMRFGEAWVVAGVRYRLVRLTPAVTEVYPQIDAVYA